MEVDYLKKTAKKSIIKSDFYGMTETLETYENNMKNSSDSNEEITFTDEEFKNLFQPGGELYPIYLQKLVPVESKMNNDNCQVCVPSDELTKDIPGYIKSKYTIYKKSNDLYDITTIMNQLDELSGKILMQYCNIKIYILK